MAALSPFFWDVPKIPDGTTWSVRHAKRCAAHAALDTPRAHFVLKTPNIVGVATLASRPAFLLEADRRYGRYVEYIIARVSMQNILQRPGNLAHSKSRRKLINILLRNKSMRRLAGFQSSE
jgi:hypothetical protein